MVHTLCRAQFVIHPHDFKLHAGNIGFVELFRYEFKSLQCIAAHGRHETRQGVNPSNLDRLPFLRKGGSLQEQKRGQNDGTNIEVLDHVRVLFLIEVCKIGLGYSRSIGES